MDYFNAAASLAAVAMVALLIGGIRGLVKGTIAKQKAWLMIVLAILTAFNLYMWTSMPAPPPA